MHVACTTVHKNGSLRFSEAFEPQSGVSENFTSKALRALRISKVRLFWEQLHPIGGTEGQVWHRGQK